MRPVWLARGALVLAATGSAALAQETITIRSGVDPITYVGNLEPEVPLRSAPFTAADFEEALAGPVAPVVAPFFVWVHPLSCDPLPEWIAPGGAGGLVVGSGLFACRFEVTTPGDPLGTIELCWAADDLLGDLDGGPNEAGLYLNGEPLGDAFRGPDAIHGGSLEASAVQVRVPLRSGANTLHLYQRDSESGYSGLLFRCRITVEGAGECEVVSYCHGEPNSTGLAAALAVEGSLSVSANQMALVATQCPPGAAATFVYGAQPAQLPFGDGVLCISPFHPGLFRVPPPRAADLSGALVQRLDFPSLPAQGAILGGSTWHFQLVYRDAAAGGACFNTSEALRVTFCP